MWTMIFVILGIIIWIIWVNERKSKGARKMINKFIGGASIVCPKCHAPVYPDNIENSTWSPNVVVICPDCKERFKIPNDWR